MYEKQVLLVQWRLLLYNYYQYHQTEIARRLWSRSISRYNLEYAIMISDGDSKAFTAVNGLQYPVEKEESVNHVSKRLRSALLKLVKDRRKVGGQGAGGKLTGKAIKKLALYYGNAVSLILLFIFYIIYISEVILFRFVIMLEIC